MQRQSAFKVIKFGGSSLDNSNTIEKCLNIVKKSHNMHTVVILSAMSGITDHLLTMARTAAGGDLERSLDGFQKLKGRHEAVIETLLKSQERIQRLKAEIGRICEDFRMICQGLSTLRELTLKATAKSVARGERMMALIFAEILAENGIAGNYVDATEIIKVTGGPYGTSPESDLCEKAAAAVLLPRLEKGDVVVMPGFIAEDESGEVVTLGRGGSDYSATIIAEAIHAESVTLYKEVDGLMTADPRYVPDARIVPQFHYREAAELAYYGAKILHPKSIIPLIFKQIPLTIKNTFAPENPGTRISSDIPIDSYPVKALTAIPDQAMISVEGNGMMGVPGIAAKTFAAIARHDISVSVISQSSSESSICFVVPMTQAKTAQETLRGEFRFEIEHHLIDDIKMSPGKAVVAVVGLGMSGTRGTAARVFTAVAREDVNIIAIAQGSSELNISFVIESKEVPTALKALHAEFKLEKTRPLSVRDNKDVCISLFGLGQIGRTLVSQLLQQRDYFESQIQVKTRLVGIADSSGILVKEEGFSESELTGFKALKENGGHLLALPGPSSGDYRRILSQKLWSLPFGKGIFVDLTASDSIPIIKDALMSGMHVVVANKKTLVCDYEEYEEIQKIVRRKKLMFRYEATVGAGLPILDTIAKLQAAGDVIETILGCLSGTIGFIMTEMEDGKSFSDAVREAFNQGYTEPDPREDLSGADVARKTLILARAIGYRINMCDVHLEPLFTRDVDSEDPRAFIDNLKRLDEDLKEKVREASLQGKVLRYVARISAEEVSVKLEAVTRESPFGGLRGTDNQVIVRTRRYDKNPLVVTGPGAGAGVTAAGVLNDIIAIATSYDRG
ncbi:MAG: bifunctional aspartate kinase/homoserine dehydrogenase I [Oligoflexales bacterium]|nr:bifunctional aspartate kinase/homoserine dehydrogenase I [Oligoflexales bacterium]